MGYRCIAFALTIAVINVCAWSQTRAWKNADLPGGARITAIATGSGDTLSSTSTTLLAGSANGRIFRSPDRGDTWTETLDGTGGAPLVNFLHLKGAVLAAAGLHVDMGIADCFSMICPDLAAAGGIFRSTDEGRTWTRVTGVPGITAMTVKGASLYAAGLKALYLSTDQGLTWTSVSASGSSPLGSAEIVALEWQGASLLAATRSALFRAKGGANMAWELLGIQVDAMAASPVSGIVISGPPAAAGGNLPDTSGGIRCTVDGGMTWKTLSPLRFKKMRATAYGLLGLADEGPQLSEDGGATWKPFSAGIPHLSSAEGSLLLSDRIYAGGFDNQGVHAADRDGGPWHTLNRGMHDWATPAVLVHKGALIAADGEGGLLVRASAGSAWADASSVAGSGQKPFRPSFLAARGNRLFVSGGAVGYSDAAGAPGSWTAIASTTGEAIAPAGDWFGLFSKSSWVFLACSNGDAPSCKTGAMAGFPKQFFSPISGAPYLTLRTLAAEGEEAIAVLDTIFATRDRGDSWTSMGKTPEGFAFLGFAPRRAGQTGRLLMGAGDSLYQWRTETGSAGRWQVLPHPGLKGALRNLAFRGEDEIYVSTDAGVFAKGTWDQEWRFLGEVPGGKTRSLSADGNLLSASLEKGGIYTLDLDPVSGLTHRAGQRVRLPGIGARSRSLGLFADGRGGTVRADGARLRRPR